MRYSTSEISIHRILGLSTCLLGCVLIIIGASPHLQSWNFFHLPVQTRVIVRIWIAFGIWLFGALFAIWPEIKKSFS